MFTLALKLSFHRALRPHAFIHHGSPHLRWKPGLVTCWDSQHPSKALMLSGYHSLRTGTTTVPPLTSLRGSPPTRVRQHILQPQAVTAQIRRAYTHVMPVTETILRRTLLPGAPPQHQAIAAQVCLARRTIFIPCLIPSRDSGATRPPPSECARHERANRSESESRRVRSSRRSRLEYPPHPDLISHGSQRREGGAGLPLPDRRSGLEPPSSLDHAGRVRLRRAEGRRPHHACPASPCRHGGVLSRRPCSPLLAYTTLTSIIGAAVASKSKPETQDRCWPPPEPRTGRISPCWPYGRLAIGSRRTTTPMNDLITFVWCICTRKQPSGMYSLQQTTKS
jgi:hypothetical protein